MNNITSFSRYTVKNGKLVVETVIETSLALIPLEGEAKIIAFGGNGSFKFTLNGNCYTANINKEYALPEEGLNYNPSTGSYAGGVSKTSQAFSIENLTFNGVQPTREEWSQLYVFNNSTSYWKEV